MFNPCKGVSFQKLLRWKLMTLLGIKFALNMQATVYSAKNSGVCVTFLSNVHSKQDATVRFNGVSYNLPAWSVSVFPDCKNVIYNTARVSDIFY